MSLNRSYTSGIKVASYTLQDSSTTDYIYVPVGTSDQYGVLKLGTASGTAAQGNHSHTLEIKSKTDYNPTTDTVPVITYYDYTSRTLGTSTATFSYTRANVPTKQYVDTTFLTQTAFTNYSASGMKYMGSTTSVPAATSSGEVYYVSSKITTGLGTGVTAEKGDFIVSYKDGSNITWSVWDKNVETAAYFGSTTITSGDIVVADGTAGGVKTQTAAQLSLATTSDIANMVTASAALTANAIVLGNGNKTVTTTTSYYPTKSTTAWANSDTKIPTELAVGKYIDNIGYVKGNGTGGQLAIWKGTAAGSKEIEGRTIQTTSWTGSLTNIPTTNAVGAYIASKGFLTAQDHDGKANAAAGRLTYWTDNDTHAGVSNSYGNSSTKYAYVEAGVLKEGTLPTVPNNYSSISVPTHSTAVTDAISSGSAVTLNPASSTDTLTIASVNKWIHIKGTEGTAGNDKVQFSHALKGTGGTAALKKIAWDEAGHIGASADVTIDKKLQYTTYTTNIDFILPLGDADPTGTQYIVTNIS